MQYYTVNDIMEFTKCGNNKSYEIIRNLNKKYKAKYPDCEIIQGQVPKWFYNQAMGMDEIYKKEEGKE